MKKIYSIILSFGITFSIQAGNEDFPIGARSAGMGNASVSQSDVWSAHHNQAGLGFVRDISAGVYYENRFLLKELSIKGGVMALPVKGGTFGLCISNFGYSLYNENKYSLSFAKAFGNKLSAGIAMDYLTTKIAEGYGSRGVLAAEFGIQAKPLKGLTIGAHVFNPTRAKIADYNDERLPTIIRFGGDYSFSDKVTVAVETEKDIAKKAIFKAGIEYKPVKEFYLRAGVGTNPTLTSFGFGINLKNLKIDVSANYHQTLGISPQIGLTYSFKKTETTSPKIEQ
ncbi:MAG: hypothetical protein NTX97_00515 [Bacteroidetes bacterium]|nr:hypothetical protein [Bacteroidota bacterium]